MPPETLHIEGNDGDDRLRADESGRSSVSGFFNGIKGLAGDDVVIGTPGPDTLSGGTGDDVVVGNDGDDRIDGGLGGDVMSGGRGVDEGTYLVNGFSQPRTIPITVQSGDGVCNDGSTEDVAQGSRPAPPSGVSTTCGSGAGAERDDFQGDLEEIIATNGADSVIGGPAGETITGLGGADQLEGGGGKDTLVGAGNLPNNPPPTDNDNDLLLLRDNLADNGAVCGGGSEDRAVADADDPVSADCERVERGAGGVTGPGNGFVIPPVGTVGGEPEPGQDPTEPQPIEVPPTTPGAPPTGTDDAGAGPGGGDGGKTAPELKIFGETLLIDEKGKAQARITCVYRAKECKGTAVLSPAKTLKSGKLKIKKSETVGDSKITIPWGRTADVPIKVSKDLVKFLKKEDSAKLTLSVSASDSGAGKNAKVAKAKRKLETELGELDAQSSRYGTVVTIRCRSNSSTRLT